MRALLLCPKSRIRTYDPMLPKHVNNLRSLFGFIEEDVGFEPTEPIEFTSLAGMFNKPL